MSTSRRTQHATPFCWLPVLLSACAGTRPGEPEAVPEARPTQPAYVGWVSQGAKGWADTNDDGLPDTFEEVTQECRPTLIRAGGEPSRDQLDFEAPRRPSFLQRRNR
jgi:hypothetical protein